MKRLKPLYQHSSSQLWFIPSLMLMLALCQPAIGQTFTTDNSYAEVQGSTAMSTYTGTSQQLEGAINLNDSTVQFSLPLNSLETGISLRNQHMRSTLDVEQHPTTTFQGKIISGFPQPGKMKQITVKGAYTIHGVTKQIEVSGTVSWQGDQMTVNASFPILITEYGMERPSVMMMSVYDEHQISIEAILNQ